MRYLHKFFLFDTRNYPHTYHPSCDWYTPTFYDFTKYRYFYEYMQMKGHKNLQFKNDFFMIQDILYIIM